MTNRLDRKNRFFFKSVIAVTLIVIGLMVVIFWRICYPETPVYYRVAMNQGQKQLVPLQALDSRIFPREALLLWVQGVVGDIYTFNGVTYQQKFADTLANSFTTSGADSFRKTLESSQLLKQVIDQQLNMTGLVSGQPVILQQGFLLGTYTWKVQMPVLLTFESASEIRTKHIIVTVSVVNVPTEQNPAAVAIDQFWSEEL